MNKRPRRKDRRENTRFEVRHMMKQIRKGYLTIVYSIGGYRLREWNLERRLSREIHRMLQEAGEPA